MNYNTMWLEYKWRTNFLSLRWKKFGHVNEFHPYKHLIHMLVLFILFNIDYTSHRFITIIQGSRSFGVGVDHNGVDLGVGAGEGVCVVNRSRGGGRGLQPGEGGGN